MQSQKREFINGNIKTYKRNLVKDMHDYHREYNRMQVDIQGHRAIKAHDQREEQRQINGNGEKHFIFQCLILVVARQSQRERERESLFFNVAMKTCTSQSHSVVHYLIGFHLLFSHHLCLDYLWVHCWTWLSDFNHMLWQLGLLYHLLSILVDHVDHHLDDTKGESQYIWKLYTHAKKLSRVKC